MAVAEPFDDYDAEVVVDRAVRLYWDAELARGAEVISYDDLDPARQHEVRQKVMQVAPHVIKALREALIRRAPIIVPDMIPDYFYGDGKE